MNKATTAPESAEPLKFKNAALLNRLSEMVKAPYYATACDTLVMAEMAIVGLERENAALRAEVERAQDAVPATAFQLAMSRVGRVYLAGPMTGYENFNFPAFNAAAQRLRAEGFDVVNPADHGIVEGAEWADYLRFDLGKLVQCASIALLPGWEASKGANLEVSVAQKLGMFVRCLDGATRPPAQAEPAPAPVGEYPALPKPARQGPWPGDPAYFIERQMHAYIDADRAQPGKAREVRLLTRKETRVHFDGVETSRDLDPDYIQRKFCEVNSLTVKEQS